LGSFLRSFTFGHIRQLDAMSSRFLAGLASRTPVVAGIGDLVMVDIDDTIIEVHGYAKQGSGYGYSGVRGLNAILAKLTTKDTAPVIVAQRLRKGSCGSPRGAKRLVTDALSTVKKLSGQADAKVLLRADSAFYGHGPVGAAVRAGAQVSVTVRLDPRVKAAFHAFFTTSTLDTITADKDPPRPRHHRTSPRRPEGLSAGPPSLRQVHCKRGLAGAGGNGVQPYPRCSDIDRHLDGQGHDRHDPPQARSCARPGCVLGPAPDTAPAAFVALGERLDCALHWSVRTSTAGRKDLTTAPNGPTRKPWNTADSKVGESAAPSYRFTRRSRTGRPHRTRRWIEVKPVGSRPQAPPGSSRR
jgi:hypothetical protein